MFIKWIVCEVSPDQRDAFAAAQVQWHGLSDCQGFVVQAGGWDSKHDNHACVLTVWSDESSHGRFMAGDHDAIELASGQKATYQACTVRPFVPLLSLGGDFASALVEGRCVRVAQCTVHKERVDHFLQVQADLWTPAMSNSHGMVGAVFCQSVHAPEHFLVLSSWASEAAHRQYAAQTLPSLRDESQVSEDVLEVLGRLLLLESSWLVRRQH